MANHVGVLIKNARTAAGFTQEQLAGQIDGVTAGDISKAERGEKELPQTVLKQIAKLTGVTQTSLIEAAKNSDYTGASGAKKKPAASSANSGKKSATSSAGTSKKPAASTGSGKRTTASSTSSGKKPAAASGMQLTASEKQLVELYRKASPELKKQAVSVLKGEAAPGLMDVLGTILSNTLK